MNTIVISRMALAALLLAPLSGCAPSPHDIAARGDLERLKSLVEGDADLVHARNDMEKTPLHYAATNGRTDIIAYLLEQGADIDAADVTGMTPMHVAATLDREEVVKQLLDAGADPEQKDSFGDTPLHSAAMHGSMETLELLVNSGADARVQNEEGLTPRELAVRHRRDAAAERLRGAGG